jgi:hypothetical protein
MRKVVLGLAVLGVSACASARPVAFQGAAPEGALDCALGKATELGYYPLDGGRDAGFIRMARATEYTAGEVAQEATARLLTMGLAGSNRQKSEHITLTGAGGMLRVQLLGFDEQDNPVNPNKAAQDRARGILEACS